MAFVCVFYSLEMSNIPCRNATELSTGDESDDLNVNTVAVVLDWIGLLLLFLLCVKCIVFSLACVDRKL